MAELKVLDCDRCGQYVSKAGADRVVPLCDDCLDIPLRSVRRPCQTPAMCTAALRRIGRQKTLCSGCRYNVWLNAL